MLEVLVDFTQTFSIASGCGKIFTELPHVAGNKFCGGFC
ncbi:hypothetical protein UF75_3740 [Desulfosporosinus sp. I2]|nr:hypothetical protein UF75_3740 [Desulfosporosinus sp. I2]